MTKPDVVIVLGVARSGTSCVSGMLSALGVDFDDGALLEATAFNPKGYFESLLLNDLLDKQVQSLRGAWQDWDVPLLPNVQDYLDARIAAATGVTIGIKDTRLVSCGLPVLRYLRDECGLDVRVVRTSRAKHANAKSLESWHAPVSAQKLSAMLNRHLEQTERVLWRKKYLMQLVKYESVLANPTIQAARLAEFAGTFTNDVARAAEFVDPSLNHHGKATQ